MNWKVGSRFESFSIAHAICTLSSAGFQILSSFLMFYVYNTTVLNPLGRRGRGRGRGGVGEGVGLLPLFTPPPLSSPEWAPSPFLPPPPPPPSPVLRPFTQRESVRGRERERERESPLPTIERNEWLVSCQPSSVEHMCLLHQTANNLLLGK